MNASYQQHQDKKEQFKRQQSTLAAAGKKFDGKRQPAEMHIQESCYEQHYNGQPAIKPEF